MKRPTNLLPRFLLCAIAIKSLRGESSSFIYFCRIDYFLCTLSLCEAKRISNKIVCNRNNNRKKSLFRLFTFQFFSFWFTFLTSKSFQNLFFLGIMVQQNRVNEHAMCVCMCAVSTNKSKVNKILFLSK